MNTAWKKIKPAKPDQRERLEAKTVEKRKTFKEDVAAEVKETLQEALLFPRSKQTG